jgi:hypothetical protein
MKSGAEIHVGGDDVWMDGWMDGCHVQSGETDSITREAFFCPEPKKCVFFVVPLGWGTKQKSRMDEVRAEWFNFHCESVRPHT